MDDAVLFFLVATVILPLLVFIIALFINLFSESLPKKISGLKNDSGEALTAVTSFYLQQKRF